VLALYVRKFRRIADSVGWLTARIIDRMPG
jgi:hypothetical protein